MDSENSKERPDLLNTALLSHATPLHLINCLKALGNGSEHIPFQLYCFSNKNVLDNLLPSLAPISIKYRSFLLLKNEITFKS